MPNQPTMKTIRLLSIGIVIVLSSCAEKKPTANAFNSSEDTLILETTKFKGEGLFNTGAGSLSLKDTTEWKELLSWFDFGFIYPNDLEDQKIGFTSIMFFPLKYYSQSNFDTIQINTSIEENTIGIVSGVISGNEIFILDENNNKDFRDDSIRTFKEWIWRSDDNLIKCNYVVKKKDKTVRDSGWVKFGIWDERILKSTSQHLEANFTIDNNLYTLGVVDDNSSSFCYYSPVFALLGENQVRRDTLLDRDILELGEYVKLGDSFYKINKFYSGSGHIRLIRENDFEKKIGVQVGSIAPSFEFISNSGDTINSSVYKGKDYLIANVSGCSPRSYDVFKDICSSVDNALKVIGVDSGIKDGLEGLLIDVENNYNSDFYEYFRNAYSSYDCYLVGDDGRIKDRFRIFDWESYLTEYQK